jgi:epoxide hydrolase-like predicted phosphatase
MLKAVLFDFGGVIYQHPKQVISIVLAQIFDKPIDIVVQEYNKYKDDYFTGKLSTDELISSLSSIFKTNKSLDEIKILWLKFYANLAKPNSKVLEVIGNLRQNYKVYLFSNTTQMSDAHNNKTGIYDYFDATFLSFQMGMKKPDQEIYDKVLSSIGFRPQECVFIDDDLKNLKPAEKMGMKTILFNVLTDSPSKLKEKLKKLKE